MNIFIQLLFRDRVVRAEAAAGPGSREGEFVIDNPTGPNPDDLVDRPRAMVSFRFIGCCIRICSAMAGVPHHPLLPSLMFVW